MPVTNYHTIDGEILDETTAGVRTDYMKDASGSVTGTTASTNWPCCGSSDTETCAGAPDK